MKIKNITQSFIISNDVQRLDSIFDKIVGLLNPKHSRSLFFKTRFGIHTFFLKEPIDILILDNSWKVVRVKKNLKPNCLFFWNFRYYLVLELPGGTANQTKTGDQLKLIPEPV